MKIAEYYYAPSPRRLRLKFVSESEAEDCLLDQMSAHDPESGAATASGARKFIWHSIKVGA